MQRTAVGVDRVFLSRSDAQARRAGMALAFESGVRGRHSMCQDRGMVAKPAAEVLDRAEGGAHFAW